MSGPDWENIDQRVRQIEDSDPNAEISAVLHELPEETEEGTVTVAGKEWNYHKFREAAQTHQDTTRIVALAKALWPNVEIRKRMRLKIRSNSPRDSIEIDLKDIMAIKSAAEQLVGIRNLQMKEKCKLKRYRDIIGNMLKCLRNRCKNSEANATRNLREDADTGDTGDGDHEPEEEEEDEEEEKEEEDKEEKADKEEEEEDRNTGKKK